MDKNLAAVDLHCCQRPNEAPMKSVKEKTAILLAFVVLVLAQACMPVAPYQRAFLNDEDMQLAARKAKTFESNIESYREGASGANGGKIGGGCGCN